MMIPKGLKPPARDALKSHAGGMTRPPDYPTRIPFVPNEPCTYGDSESVAICLWDLGRAGAEDRAAFRDRVASWGEGMRRGDPIDHQQLKEAGAQMFTAPPAAIERLETLLQSLTVAALADGWHHAGPPTLAGPPGNSFRRFVRDGQVMIAMANAISLGQGLSVWSFEDKAA